VSKRVLNDFDDELDELNYRFRFRNRTERGRSRMARNELHSRVRRKQSRRESTGNNEF
jgi:hypothetical protein